MVPSAPPPGLVLNTPLLLKTPVLTMSWLLLAVCRLKVPMASLSMRLAASSVIDPAVQLAVPLLLHTAPVSALVPAPESVEGMLTPPVVGVPPETVPPLQLNPPVTVTPATQRRAAGRQDQVRRRERRRHVGRAARDVEREAGWASVLVGGVVGHHELRGLPGGANAVPAIEVQRHRRPGAAPTIRVPFGEIDRAADVDDRVEVEIEIARQQVQVCRYDSPPPSEMVVLLARPGIDQCRRPGLENVPGPRRSSPTPAGLALKMAPLRFLKVADASFRNTLPAVQLTVPSLFQVRPVRTSRPEPDRLDTLPAAVVRLPAPVAATGPVQTAGHGDCRRPGQGACGEVDRRAVNGAFTLMVPPLPTSVRPAGNDTTPLKLAV